METVGKHAAVAAALAWAVELPDAYKAFGLLMLVDMVSAVAAAGQRQDGSISLKRCWAGIWRKLSLICALVGLEVAGRWLGVPRDLAPWAAMICAGHELLSILQHSRSAMPEWLARAIQERINPTIQKSTSLEEKR